jgi:serine/threonine protein kinase
MSRATCPKNRAPVRTRRAHKRTQSVILRVGSDMLANSGGTGPYDLGRQEDDFDSSSRRRSSAKSGTLLTPGGQHPWTEPEALLGSLLGDRYSLVRLIGQGGMGAVYQAHHVVIGKTIAVKVLGPDYSRNPGDVQRFLQEARAASLIRHDHVVDIADFGYTARGQAYLVMEYLEGEDLGAHRCSSVGRMGWFRVSNIVMQIGSALAAAHAKGIVHRDMKPENCFRVKRDGDADFIKSSTSASPRSVDNRPRQEGRPVADDRGRRDRHPRVHRPRAVPRAEGRRPRRHLRARHHHVPPAHRRRPVHRRERQLHGGAQPAPHRPAESHRASWSPPSPRRSSRSSCAPSRRTPTSATRRSRS